MSKVVDLAQFGAQKARLELLKSDFSSEHRSAENFCLANHETHKYDFSNNCWYIWDGSIWRIDETRRAFQNIRLWCADVSDNKKSLESVRHVSAVETFSQCDTLMATTHTLWDDNIYLLGTPKCTVDLKTGETRPAEPTDYITRSTVVSPENGEPKLWLSFLNDVFKGDQALVSYAQRACGYMLTGDTREQKFFFLSGPGGNGKGVFTNAIIEILGSYVAVSATAVFASSDMERHPTELAMLAGARLVTAQETEATQMWAESRIKSVTGGDRITARFMRKDFFTYMPQFKLLVVGNDIPLLRNTDDAMKRRLRIIPFENKIEEPDDTLSIRLKAEYGQILQWMIQGCLDWQASGLGCPEGVAETTDAYFTKQNLGQTWVEDYCEVGPQYAEQTGKLYQSWAKYRSDIGELAMSQRAFSSILVKLGFKAEKRSGNRVYSGIRLKSLRPVANGAV